MFTSSPLFMPGQYWAASAPGGFTFQQFRPEREGAALGRFGGVNGAAVIAVKVALAAGRFAQTKLGTGPYAVFCFEERGLHAKEGGGFEQIVFGKEDFAFHLAAN